MRDFKKLEQLQEDLTNLIANNSQYFGSDDADDIGNLLFSYEQNF